MLQSTLGEALMAAGATDEALDVFKRGLALSPRNIPLTMRYAEALLKADQAKDRARGAARPLQQRRAHARTDPFHRARRQQRRATPRTRLTT